MADPKLVIRIKGDSKKFRKELGRVEKDTDASLQRMQKSAKIAAAGFVVLAAGAGLAFKAFADFEEKFSDVITLLDEGSFATKTLTQGIEDLKDGVLRLRRETGESFDNLNKGLFDLISAGIDAEDAIDALRVATNLALAGATDTSIAVDGLTSALNAFELSAENAQAVSEKFFTAQKFGKTTIEELSRGFGLVGSTAASFGVSLDELLASVAAITTGGIKTSAAFTGLAAIFANITKPTADAASEAKRLGIEFNTTALRALGLKGFLDSITEAAEFNVTTLEKMFGSVEAVKTILSLTGAGADDFAKILEELADKTQSAATFQDALAVKTDTASQRMRVMRGEVEELAVSIGEKLTPALLSLGESVIEQTKNIGKGLVSVGTIVKGLATIFGQFFNIMLAEVDNFVVGSLKAIGKLIIGIETLISAIPGLEADFSFLLNSIGSQIIAFDIAAKERQLEAIRFFGTTEAEKTNILRERFDEENELLKDHFEKQAELEETARVEKAEADKVARDAETEIIEEEREKQQEQFDKDAESLTERLNKAKETKDIFANQDLLRDLLKLKNRAKNAKSLAKVDEQLSIAQQKFSMDALTTQILNLDILFGQETAVGKAIFILRKAQAIAGTITSTQEAMALARATVPPPGGDIVAARYAIAGAINVGIIAATAIQSLSAQDGGQVPGGFGGGDRVPVLLEPGEIITPERLNPLSPNFDETFGGGAGGQEVIVTIDLTEEASQFITAGQREDTTLGVQR